MVLATRNYRAVSIKVLFVGCILGLVDIALFCLRNSGKLQTTTTSNVIDNSAKQNPNEQQQQKHQHRNEPFPLQDGQWIHVGSRNRTFAAPICCGWDHKEYNKHPGECIHEKIDQNFYQGPSADDGLYQQMGGNACHKESGKKDKFIDEWEWHAPNLVLPFDAHATCRQLGQRTVLMMGDSTMQQTATTLMNALKKGGCAPQISLQLADTLVNIDMGVLNRGVYWMEAVRAHHPDIVIINAGAHIRTNSNYTRMLDQVIQDVQTWQRNFSATSENVKTVSFVWKTQQPAGCTANIFHPEDPLRAAKEFNFSHTPLYKERHHDDFYRRDMYTIQRWSTELRHVHLLDMRMLYSRSDAHPGSGQLDPIDCLHFMAPGPLDVVAPLFQRLLQSIDQN